MQIIPLNPLDAQVFSLHLSEDSYRFRLVDRGDVGMMLDVYKNENEGIMGILCLDRVRLIRSAYKRFPGELMFADQQGTMNPYYLGLNQRFLLYYLSDDEQEVGL
ncbi:hypothetical protein COMNV_00866 [Commensalibacter sp. Nvir]|uniref:phage baseplate plug family protein n=1 Tax=Commensalibacter sp. Nvir TaxID=3069817 RepID=UPI002D717847|nr:hypothetical protein COMNV_00866 [Commensalibacter sp. Nvir]